MEIILGLAIVLPSLLIIIAYSIKGFFLEDFNPYDNLRDINCFDSLRNDDGNGFKRFLAAVGYEHLKKKLLFIVDGRNLFIALCLYGLGVLNVVITDSLMQSHFLQVLVAILPNIVAALLVIIAIKIKYLKKQIGG